MSNAKRFSVSGPNEMDLFFHFVRGHVVKFRVPERGTVFVKIARILAEDPKKHLFGLYAEIIKSDLPEILKGERYFCGYYNLESRFGWFEEIYEG